MLKVEITKEMIKRSCEKAFDLGLIESSIDYYILKDLLSLEAVKSVLQCIEEKNKDYDLTCEGNSYKVKTDVVNVEPKPYHECLVKSYHSKQKFDRYIFVKVQLVNDFAKTAWVTGWIDKKDYFKKSIEMKKGEVDESSGMEIKFNCCKLKIEELNEIHSLACT
jgi:hypothetical protein